MHFDRNVIEFPTMLHRDIYMRALRLVPPEVSLAEIEKTDPAMAESGREFYGFMLLLYGDMYCNPEAYGMSPGAYEAFAAGRKWRAMRLRVKEYDEYYGPLSNVQISSYVRFIHEIATYCVVSDGCCFLSYEDFEKVKDLKRVTPVGVRQLLIPIETVMQSLERVGLYFRDDGGRIQVVNENYPNMFLSASALKHAVDETVRNPVSKKLKYYFGEYIDTLEFRQLLGNYYPDLEDQIRSLPDKDREAVLALDHLAKEYKFRPDYKASQLGFRYKYKGEPVIGVDTNNDSFFTEPNSKRNAWIRHTGVDINGSNEATYLENVEQYGDDFKDYFLKHLPLCSACTPHHLADTSGIRYIFGKKRRLCSPVLGGHISKFTASDLPYVKKYIELYLSEINKLSK